MFGEAVLYLPLKTGKSLKEQAQPKMKLGIWMGVIERTQETIIGTHQGVVKRRIVNRLPEDQRWSKDLLRNVRGTPWAPIPKARGDHILVEVRSDGTPTTFEDENTNDDLEVTFEEDIKAPSKPDTSGFKGVGMTEFHIKKPMVQKYGYIDGCQACPKLRNMSKGGQSLTGSLGANHSIECKTRIMQKMSDDPVDRHIVEGYHKRTQKSASGHASQMHISIVGTHNAQQESDTTIKQRGLERILTKMTSTTMEVAEVHSPERVTAMARSMGLNVGWALGLTTTDENGQYWNFDCVNMRNKATRLLLREKPMLLIGSPMCT